MINRYKNNCRGTALLMAMIITIALFLLGLAFVSTTMTERDIISGQNQRQAVDVALDAVINQIDMVLVNDLFANGSGYLDGKGDFYDGSLHRDEQNEPWDYPGMDDMWLAPLEPYMDTAGVYRWSQISDIYGLGINDMATFLVNPALNRNIFNGANAYDPVDQSDTNQWSGGAASLPFLVNDGIRGIKAWILPEDAGTEIIAEGGDWNKRQDVFLFGARADADGDGIADSRWVPVIDINNKPLFGPNGEHIYVAVRIIDNGGLLNLNTAFRDPAGLPGPAPSWDGSQLSHINLAGIRKNEPGGSTIADFQNLRFGNGQLSTVSELKPVDDPCVDYAGSSYTDWNYEVNVARRILNPADFKGLHYTPFSIDDELELRNRFFLSSGVKLPFGYRAYDENQNLIRVMWQNTFDPVPGYSGRETPYGFNSTDTLQSWFRKVVIDPTEPLHYNIRHIVTTYSFDRITRPYIKLKKDGKSMDTSNIKYDLHSLPPGMRKAVINTIKGTSTVEAQNINRLASAIFLGLPEDDQTPEKIVLNRFGEGFEPLFKGKERAELAWHLALNLVDYQDTNTTPQRKVIEDKSNASIKKELTVIGVEPYRHHVLCISKLGYSDVQSSPPDDKDGKYYAVEIFNPDDRDGNTKELKDYILRVTGKDGTLKGEFDLSTLAAVQDSAKGNFTNDTIWFAFTHLTKTDQNNQVTASDISKAFAGKLNTAKPLAIIQPKNGPFLLLDDDVFILTKKFGTGSSAWEMPVDCVHVPGGASPVKLIVGTGTPNVIRRYKTFPHTNLLLSQDYVGLKNPAGGLINPWKIATSQPGEKLGDDIDPDPQAPNKNLEPLNTSEGSDFAGLDKVDLHVLNRPLRTLGEIEKVLAVGYDYYTENKGKVTNEIHRCRTMLQGLMDSVIKLKKLDPADGGKDLAADQVILPGNVKLEMGSYGRIRLDDPAYWNLTRTLTYFDPSHDGVDTDGNPMTSDNPTNDDVDQDGDKKDLPGAGDKDSNENQPQYYEQAIPGRININTAPWFVLEQLPWFNQRPAPGATAEPYFTPNSALAQAMVAYRDKLDLSTVAGPNYSGVDGRAMATGIDPQKIDEKAGFRNTAQILQVVNKMSPADGTNVNPFDIRMYLDGYNATIKGPNLNPAIPPSPDYDPDDSVDDFLERNLLFHRVSNLITVRSDVFTAYILVRLGEHGPQKRVIAIFDRSNVFSRSDTPRLVALHTVPDPD